MKKIISLSAVLIFLFSSCENKSGVADAFSKYRHKDGVTSITVPGWAIGLAARWGDLDEEERRLLRNIDKVKILTIDDHELNIRSNFHDEFFKAVAQNPGMEELMVVRSDEEQVTVFGKGTEKAFDELLILVGGDDNALIYVKGKIKPEVLSDIINKNSQNSFFSLKN